MFSLLVNGAFLVVFLIGVIIVAKTSFVQFRVLPKALDIFFRAPESEVASDRLSPKQALFMSMSTTIGIGNVVGPILSIVMGGPGAMVWFLLASIIGSGVVYAEIVLAFKNRSYGSKRTIGPMAHLSKILPMLAIAYAASTSVLLMIWNSSQAHVLSDIAFRNFGFSPTFFGVALSVLVAFVLNRGTSLIRDITDKIAPFMLIVYLSALTGILISNREQLVSTLRLILSSFLSIRSAASGCISLSFLQAMRWGISRSISALEAGIGTASIPHSLSTGKDAETQATLAVLGAYVNGTIGFLTGIAVLSSGYYTADPAAHALELLNLTFKSALSIFGEACLNLSLFLFAFGTILGNAFNGLACWEYLFGKKGKTFYGGLLCVSIILGCGASLSTIFELSDPFMLVSMGLQLFGLSWFMINKRLLG
ncbi:alanine:cation symporter family protein [Candidatus Similichlamydia epinepheli]|uniref:alanine:cation symporter family protein n=1 Tax=Candidatus Similichlamydia epinepheli TaxID=1903953 RepID=UPI000D361F05|nr:alanine:cation symporter family protein [Candidatus Similichlamydia epinepheli]